MDSSGFLGFLLAFAFFEPDAIGDERFTNAWNATAFATIAAISFVAIVVVDVSSVVVIRIGFRSSGSGALGLKHGSGTLLVIIFGALGAWIVGLLAVMVNLLQVNAQTAVLTGIAWQVVYTKIIERAGTSVSSAGAAAPAADAAAGKVEQSATDEEKEAG